MGLLQLLVKDLWPGTQIWSSLAVWPWASHYHSLLSGPQLSLKLPPTLKFFNFAEKLMQWQDWPISRGRLAEITWTLLNLLSLFMGGMRWPIYWNSFISLLLVINCMTQDSLMFFQNCHGILALIRGHLFKKYRQGEWWVCCITISGLVTTEAFFPLIQMVWWLDSPSAWLSFGRG